ncbi:MAG TPA: GvpL/GvpF family gas vesicle protein [Terriglobales bacterium]|nr:GvpL/GvpF family gas vesicle protein [Terriglobales bacterium]
MAWYAYCICEQSVFLSGVRARRPFPIPGVNGIRGAQVMAYPSGEFAIIVSECEPDTVMDQPSVFDHARVVSECFRSGTVLPFRFGTIFSSDEALRRAVRSNRKALTDGVTRLRGKSEMHLKLVIRDESQHDGAANLALPHTAGSEYLTRLHVKATRQRERQSKARAISVQVHKLFNPLEEEISCKTDSSGLLLDIAHLIDSGSVKKYQSRYTAAARHLKNCEIVVTGPWPPYHFTPNKIKTA